VETMIEESVAGSNEEDAGGAPPLLTNPKSIYTL